MRVVSLVPSSTETLLALGANVVACTRFCEQPGIVSVGGTKNPDVAAVVGLGPDVVVLDQQENRIEDADALAAAGVRTFVSDVRTVADATAVVASLAELVGADVPGPDIEDGPPAGGVTPPGSLTAFVPIWRRPWMSIGPDTYGASVLAAAGCRLVTDTSGTDYPMVELAEVAAAEPDAILVPSEPYDFTAAHLDDLREKVPGAVVERIDGRDLFWWGIRTPAALRNLAAVISRLGR